MKNLLFLSFLLSTACVDALKSMLDDPEEEEDDEEDERREGQQQGDCLDGEDNDEDGDIDCADSGCADKPACDGDTAVSPDTSDDPDSDQVNFSGQNSISFSFEQIYQDEGYEDCQYTEYFSPLSDAVVDPSSCSGCTIFGRVEIEISTDCSFFEENIFSVDFAINEANETSHFYNSSEGVWVQIFDSESCNDYYNTSLSESSLSVECVYVEEDGYSSSGYLAISW